jgi:outer membrane protein, heavy metal efflux system
MRTFFVCAMFAAVVWPANARAQTVALTESAALAQLGSEHPRIRAAQAGIEIARADVVAAGRWPNPRVTFNREAVAGVSESMFTIAQALPISGRRALDSSAATSLVQAGTSRAEERVRRVRADLRLAFTDVWVAQERERELAQTEGRLSGLVEILAKREAAGDAAGFDRLRAEREVVDIEVRRATATVEGDQARATLGSFLSPRPTATAIEAVQPAASAAAVPTVAELVARAETARGDLRALAREADAAGFAEQSAGRRSIPDPEVAAGTKSSNVAGGDVGGILSVHVTVPLFDRGAPERALAQARGRQARAEADVLRQTVRAQIEAWRAALVERRRIAERHRSMLAAGTGDIERIARVSYEAGERGILELLDASRTMSATRIRQIELDAAVREAEIELEFASGWEMP